jgi:hypothetical protein
MLLFLVSNVDQSRRVRALPRQARPPIPRFVATALKYGGIRRTVIGVKWSFLRGQVAYFCLVHHKDLPQDATRTGGRPSRGPRNRATALVVWPVRTWREIKVGYVSECPAELHHARLYPGPDVVRTGWRILFEGERVSARDVPT